MQELLVSVIVGSAVLMLVRGFRASLQSKGSCGGCPVGAACSSQKTGGPKQELPTWSEGNIPRGGLPV